MKWYVITIVSILAMFIPIGIMGFRVYHGQRTALLILKIQFAAVVALFIWGSYLLINSHL